MEICFTILKHIIFHKTSKFEKSFFKHIDIFCFLSF